MEFDLYNLNAALIGEIGCVRDELERIYMDIDRQAGNRILVQIRAIESILADYEKQANGIMKGADN